MNKEGVDFVFLPGVLQDLLTKHRPPKKCGNCGKPAALRCSGCRCATYCSADCQKVHRNQHKKNCKSVSKHRKAVKELHEDETPLVGRAQVTAQVRVLVRKVNLADALLKAGCNECRTVAEGRVPYFYECLQMYLSPLYSTFIQGTPMRKVFKFLNDRAMLMILVCGGGTEELEPVFMNCNGHDVDARAFRQMIAKSGNSTGIVDLLEKSHMAHIMTRAMLTEEGGNCDRLAYHAFWLMNYMLELSKYREDQQRLDLTQDALTGAGNEGLGDDVRSHLFEFVAGDKDYFTSVLPANICAALNGVAHNGGGTFASCVKNEIPFPRDHALGLFRSFGQCSGTFDDDEPLEIDPANMGMMLREISYRGAAPPESWVLYQRCILEAFEGPEILREFIQD